MATTASLVARTQEEAATTLGVHRRTFHSWLKQGCPGEPGAYVIVEAIQWAKENRWDEDGALVEGATGEEGDLKTAYLKTKKEKVDRENRMLDFKIDMQRERLVDVDVVEPILMEQANILRAGLEKIERKQCPNDCVGAVIELIEELEQIDLRSGAE